MKPPRSLIPIGTATLLPQTAQRVRHLEEELLGFLAKWGYQEIILPSFEYLDILSAGLPSDVLEKCYKFADWATGRILVLRPDATAQIARMVAMGLGGEAMPLRISYRTTVFRYEPEHRGRDREIFQVGLELLGKDNAEIDTEIVALLVGMLDHIKLPNWKISLGHVGFITGLLARSGLSSSGQKQAELAAARKDLPRLEEILTTEGLSKSQIRKILQVPGKCGQEEILEWGKGIAGNDSRLLHPLNRLTEVFRRLKAIGIHQHVLLDLGEFRGFDYYDGMVFDVFTSGLGREVGGGGRYNHLVGRFGRELPAIGLGLDLDGVFSALENGGALGTLGPDPLLLLATPRQAPDSFTLSQILRKEGYCVIEERIQGKADSSLRQIAKMAHQRGIPRVILFEPSKGSPTSVTVLELKGFSLKPRKSGVSIDQVPAQLRDTSYGSY